MVLAGWKEKEAGLVEWERLEGETAYRVRPVGTMEKERAGGLKRGP